MLFRSLEGLAVIGSVSVGREQAVSSASGYTWTVVFETNIGAQPLMELTTTDVGGALDASTGVQAAIEGSLPGFDQGTIGITVLPLGQTDVEQDREMQRITATTGDQDLDGSFTVTFMGSVSRAISIHSTAEEVKAALEDVHTIGVVSVVRTDLTQSTVAPVSRFGVQFEDRKSVV